MCTVNMYTSSGASTPLTGGSRMLPEKSWGGEKLGGSQKKQPTGTAFVLELLQFQYECRTSWLFFDSPHFSPPPTVRTYMRIFSSQYISTVWQPHNLMTS